MQKTITYPFAIVLALAIFACGTTFTFAKTSYDEIELEYETIGNKTIVTVEYIEDEDEDDTLKSKEFIYFTSDLDSVWKKVANELDISVDDIEDILDGTYGSSDDEGNRDDAKEAIKNAERALEDASYEIEDEDDADKKEKLEGYHDDAEEYLNDAREAFEAGDYGDAEEWAEKAEELVNKNVLGIDDSKDKEDAEEAIEDAEEKIAEAGTYVESLDEADSNRTTFESYLEVAEGYLADAEEAFADKEYEDAEDWAKKAENKAKLILEDDSEEDSNKGHGNDDDGCDDDNPGKKCDDSSSDDYKNFGKSTDREELQKQLRMLLMLLIELLQKKM